MAKSEPKKSKYACVRIPRRLYQQLKVECVRSGETLTALMVRRLKRPDGKPGFAPHEVQHEARS